MDERIIKKLEDFFKSFKTVNYKKNEIILKAGEPLLGVYFLEEGFVRQYFISQEGEEVTIYIFKPFSFFPVMLLLAKSDNRYYFQAHTDVEVKKADPEKVLAFLKDNPDVHLDLTNRLASAVVSLSRRIEMLAIGSAYVKILSLIFYLGKTFGKDFGDRVLINIPVTHYDIASWVGVKRETASRQIILMIDKGLISWEKHHLVILSQEKLVEELRLKQCEF